MAIDKERRKFIRLNLDKPIKVEVKSVPLKVSFGSLLASGALGKNISIGGGLLIELAIKSEAEIGKFLYGKKKLSLRINIPGMSSIRAKGRVVWLKKMEKQSNLYRAGISFDNINEITREKLIHAMIDLCFRQECDI
ncbi:MAG: hypothetical protein DRP74_03145 [Candidatus Omnitrophota bacterium]|nr:MAG: hypothetical protein DRP74_03145 [Candidatus Omnitrophota bacterium]